MGEGHVKGPWAHQCRSSSLGAAAPNLSCTSQSTNHTQTNPAFTRAPGKAHSCSLDKNATRKPLSIAPSFWTSFYCKLGAKALSLWSWLHQTGPQGMGKASPLLSKARLSQISGGLNHQSTCPRPWKVFPTGTHSAQRRWPGLGGFASYLHCALSCLSRRHWHYHCVPSGWRHSEGGGEWALKK